LDIPEIEPQYVIIIRKKGYLDQLHVDVEAKRETYEGVRKKIAAVEKKSRSEDPGIIGLGSGYDWCPPRRSREARQGEAGDR